VIRRDAQGLMSLSEEPLPPLPAELAELLAEGH
jgi:hypothetical protein